MCVCGGGGGIIRNYLAQGPSEFPLQCQEEVMDISKTGCEGGARYVQFINTKLSKPNKS